MRVRPLLGVVLAAALTGAAAVPPSDATPSAREIHHSALVVDLHCDTVLDLQAGSRRLGERSSRGHVDLPRLRDGGVGVQVFAIYVAPGAAGGGRARARAHELIGVFHAAAADHPGEIAQVRTAAEIDAVRRTGRIAAVLSIENGDALGGSLEALDAFYRLGVRMLGLTWNASNGLGDGAMERRHGGLTDFGRAVLRRMESLGIVPDASHLSEAAFWDLLRATRGPLVASHSNAAALHPHPRNLTDAQLRAIAGRGGVVGVTFYPGFLGGPSLARVVDHIEHMVRVMGIDHVALGADYDGIPAAAVGLEDVSRLPALTTALVARGYTRDRIHKILGGNALRVFRQALK